MTYKTIISHLSDQVRDARAWPVNADEAKLTQQLRLVYAATLAVALELPLPYLAKSKKTEDLSADEPAAPFSYDLPDDIFARRPDYGFVSLKAGTAFIDWNSPQMYDDAHVFLEFVNSSWTKGRPAAFIDFDERLVRTNTAECSITYIPLFTLPDSANYHALEFPLPRPMDEQVLQLTAAHVQSILAGNGGKAAIHNALSEVYGVEAKVKGEAEGA